MKEILNCPFKFDNNAKIVFGIEEDINDFHKKTNLKNANLREINFIL
jgi:hypothetical protein